jgi:DNA polymerase III delta subunit
MPVSSEKTAEITLSSLLGAHAPPSVTVITSPDTLRRSQAVRQCEQRFSSRDARCVIRARETSLEAIKTELFSSSLFGANNSLIIVKGAHELPTAIGKGLRQILTKKNEQLTPILF